MFASAFAAVNVAPARYSISSAVHNRTNLYLPGQSLNGYNERFNGTLRHEVLNPEAFYSWAEAQGGIAQWVRQYNHTRPHPSLNNRPPVPETIAPALFEDLVHTQGA